MYSGTAREGTGPVRIGLVGAGPWAAMVHAPVFAAGPDTVLTAVWARRAEAARELASRHDAVACGSFTELLERCDAVVFAVAPTAQPEFAALAAASGRPVLLEKPLAGDLAAARGLADRIEAAGVPSMLALTARYSPEVRGFLSTAAATARDTPWAGGRVVCVTGAFLEGPFAASPWRRERGALLDVGPHVFDLLDVTLGPVTGLRVDVPAPGWTALQLAHEGGAVSQVVLCSSATGGHRYELELFGTGGAARLDLSGAVGPAAFARMREDFVRLVREGGGHPCDARRGVRLQEVIARAEAQVAAGA